MLYIQTIIQKIIKLICSFSLSDIIEILILTTIVYNFSLWIKKDRQKNLLIPFYLFCMSAFLSSYLNLYILSYIFMTTTPIALIIFIVLHQETLQKNFVSLQNKSLPKDKTFDWINGLIGSCLLALNKNQNIVILIERNTNLDNLVKTPFKFYADLEKEIFQILLEKHIANDNYMVWINHTGKLVAINFCWIFDIANELISQEMLLYEKWKQKSIFITGKSDAIIIKITATSRSFDIIIQGKAAPNLSPNQAFDIIKSNLETNKQTTMNVPKTKYSQQKTI